MNDTRSTLVMFVAAGILSLLVRASVGNDDLTASQAALNLPSNDVTFSRELISPIDVASE